MNEFWLIFSFIILSLLALPLMFYPLRQSKLLLSVAAPVFIICLFLAYLRWGTWTEWQKNVHKEDNNQKIEALLKTIKSPVELIDRMKGRLTQDPKSERGWYLLGRLYASQGQWLEAREAFLRAQQLNPDDELASVNYVNSLWQLNQQQFDKHIREQLKILLEKNPNQPDALAMLAIDAYKRLDYQEAINHWQLLLKLAPEQSEEAQMIRKAIAKAQFKLKK